MTTDNKDIETETTEESFSPREIKRGKIGFISNEAISDMGANFVGGTFLSALMIYLGISPSKIALLFSLASFSGLAMIVAPYVSSLIKRPKLFLWFGILLNTVPMSFVFLFPWLGFGPETFPIIAGLYLLINLSGKIISPLYTECRQFYAEKKGRADMFYSWNSTVGNGMTFLVLIVITLLCTKYQDSNPKFLYLLFGILSLICYAGRLSLFSLLIKEPNLGPTKKPENVFRGISEMICDTRYRPFLLYSVLIAAGAACVSGVETVFFISRMGLEINFLSFMNLVAFLGRMVLSPFVGMLSKVIGTRKGLAVCILFCSVSYGVNIFMTPGNAAIIRILATVFGLFGFSGNAILSASYQFKVMPNGKHISYMSYVSLVSNVVGLLVGILVSGIVEWTEGMYVVIWGFRFSELHFFFVGSTILWILAAVVLSFSRKKAEQTDNCL